MTAVHTWEVIGGAISGGLLVRSGRALGSERESQRLRTGSVVEQIELDGERLHYKLLEGAGPLTGWDIIAVALNVAPTVQTGPRFRVTKVCDDTLLEIEPSEAAVSLEDFWPKDCPFDSKKQHYVYWAIVCSSSCDTWTMALALTLKELSDYGVILTHESRPVTNIVVLNTPTMDVGDLLPTAVELLEPGSGARVSMFSTPASQLTLKMLGPEVQERLGWGVSPTFTEELRNNFIERFGEASLTQTDSFITPCYVMTPYHSQQMFIVHPEVVNYVPNDAKFTAVSEIRHLRCFYHGHPGYLTATPLPSFVDGEKTSWLRLHLQQEGLQSIASFFRAEIFKTLEPGTYVEVDDSCDNASFKGRLGKVLPAATGEVEHLLQLNGLAEPARVHPTALKLYPRYVQHHE
eukprot:g4086.t1